MYLFFDTETNGLPKNWKAPITDLNNWPRLVQIAWVIYDNSGVLIDQKDFIVKPNGFTIPRAASNIHGISTERANTEGIDLNDVLTQLLNDLTTDTTLVAHNIAFDEKIVGAEYLRQGMTNPFEGLKTICTMKETTSFVGIYGPYGLKWPKLSELHIKLFGVDFEEAHDARADINATAKCFWEAKKRGIIS